jgi:phosphatidylglycerol:prolipoprotein diacylglycerol transferase
MLSYLIWNGSPEIFSIGYFTLRWYGLLFALGFLVSQQILYYMYRQEGKPEKDVDTLTIYMIVATIIGARMGHVIFYQPELFWENPLSIILPFEFSPFRFTGFQGLASHGGAFGILFALWLYSRKKKPGQNYLQVLDRIVILVCITGCFIRMGNFFNSEILGKPSNNPLSVVFINRVTEAIERNQATSPVSSFDIKRAPIEEGPNGRVPLNLFLLFKPGTSEMSAANYINNDLKYFLIQLSGSADQPVVDQPITSQMVYQISETSDKTLGARVRINAISRHPAQLYESISCFLLFAGLLWYWSKHKNNLPEGRIFGIFMIVLWGLRFAYEFLKENQESFENNLPLNMGQILSIPLVLVGVYILIRSFSVKQESQENVTS